MCIHITLELLCFYYSEDCVFLLHWSSCVFVIKKLLYFYYNVAQVFVLHSSSCVFITMKLLYFYCTVALVFFFITANLLYFYHAVDLVLLFHPVLFILAKLVLNEIFLMAVFNNFYYCVGKWWTQRSAEHPARDCGKCDRHQCHR